MTDTKTISFNDIVSIGKKRVDDVATVEVPALGGSVKLRQISGAEHDAAVAVGHAGDGEFDAHAVVREQIKASMVEPLLPPDEADTILDNLPIQAFGQLQTLVQAHSGLLPGMGVEQMVAMFRGADDASGTDGDGGAGDPGQAGDVAAGVGSTDTGADDEATGVLPGDEPDAGDGSEAAGEGSEAQEEAAGVNR